MTTANEKVTLSEERLDALIADATTEYNSAANGNDFEAGAFWGPLRDALRDYKRLRSTPTSELAKALACPRPLVMGEHACANRKQCWEPCGDLGKHPEFAMPVTASNASGERCENCTCAPDETGEVCAEQGGTRAEPKAEATLEPGTLAAQIESARQRLAETPARYKAEAMPFKLPVNTFRRLYT